MIRVQFGLGMVTKQSKKKKEGKKKHVGLWCAPERNETQTHKVACHEHEEARAHATLAWMTTGASGGQAAAARGQLLGVVLEVAGEEKEVGNEQ